MTRHRAQQADGEGDAIARGLDDGEVVLTPFSGKRKGRKARVGDEVDLQFVGVRYSDGAGEPIKRVPSARGDD